VTHTDQVIAEFRRALQETCAMDPAGDGASPGLRGV